MNQEVNSSILEKVDVFFTKIFSGLFKWVWLICLFIVGASAFAFQYLLIFGNNAGLSDVSTVEFFFFVVIAGLIWRHWKYTKKNSQSFFVTMAKTFINAGIVNVFLLAISALAFIGVYAEGESLDRFMRTFFTADYLIDLTSMAFWIFIFYFSVPIEKNNIEKNNTILETTEVKTNDSGKIDSELNSSELNGSELNSSELNSSELNSSELKSSETVQVKNNEYESAESTKGNENEVKF